MSGCLKPPLPLDLTAYGGRAPTSIGDAPIEGRKGQPVLKPGPQRSRPARAARVDRRALSPRWRNGSALVL